MRSGGHASRTPPPMPTPRWCAPYISAQAAPPPRAAWAELLQTSAAATDDADLRLVLPALARLEPVDRAVVVLRYFDDSPSRRSVGSLGLSPTAVRSRAMRALARIRTTLGHHLPDLALS